jgi:WD40 repeat protein
VLQILRLGTQMARGLAAAHAQGLVHRDIKPANILLEDGQRAKLTDFGLARAVDDVRMTRTGMVAGTPQYMSPEQAHGRPVDHRSDLFSLGSVLYEMCTGRAAFRADSAMAVLKRVCDDEQRPACEVNPAVPEWLSDIVDCLLAKDPADRIQTAAEVAELLERRLANVQEPGAFADHPPLVRRPRSSDAPRRALERAVRITRFLAAARLLVSIWVVILMFMFGAAPQQVVSLVIAGIAGFDVLTMLVCLRLLDRPQTILARRVAACLAMCPVSILSFACVSFGAYATYLMFRRDVAEVFNQDTRRKPPAQPLLPGGEDVELRGEMAPEPGLAPGEFEPRRPTGMTGTMTHFVRLYRGRGNTGRSLAIGVCLLVAAVAFWINLKSHRGTFEVAADMPAGMETETDELPPPAVPPAYISLDAIRTIPAEQARVAALGILPDGRSALAVSRDESVRLMDLQTGETIRQFRAPAQRPAPVQKVVTNVPLRDQTRPPEVAIAVSADGKLGAFAGGYDGDLRVWSLETGEQVAAWQLPGVPGPNYPGIAALQFSPDGTELLTTSGLRNALGSGTPVPQIDAVWNIADAEARLDLPVCAAGAWSPDGSKLIVAKTSQQDSELLVGSDELRPLNAASAPEQRHVTALQWLPDNRLVAVAFARNRLSHARRVYGGPISDFGAENRFGADRNNQPMVAQQTSGPQPEVAVVDTETGQTMRSLATGNSPVSQLLLLPDGVHLMVCSDDGPVTVWNLTTGQEDGPFHFVRPDQNVYIAPPPASGQVPVANRRSTPARLITAGQWTLSARTGSWRNDGGVVMFDLPLSWQQRREPQVIHELKSHTAGIQFLSFAPGGRLVSAARDGQILLWDLETESVLENITPHDGKWSPDMCVSLDGQYVTAFEGGDSRQRNVRFHEMANGAQGMVTQVRPGPPEILYSAATGEFIVPNDRSIDLWMRRTMTLNRVMVSDSLEHIGVSGDGNILLASLVRGQLSRVSVPERQVRPISQRSGAIESIAMNFDGSRAITRNSGYGDAVQIWDVNRGQLLGSLAAASDVADLAFAERDRLIVTGSVDHLRYWDASTMQSYARVACNATVLAASRDGTLVATGGNEIEDNNCVIRVWQLTKPGSDPSPSE